jgi:hypothetical protein
MTWIVAFRRYDGRLRLRRYDDRDRAWPFFMFIGKFHCMKSVRIYHEA